MSMNRNRFTFFWFVDLTLALYLIYGVLSVGLLIGTFTGNLFPLKEVEPFTCKINSYQFHNYYSKGSYSSIDFDLFGCSLFEDMTSYTVNFDGLKSNSELESYIKEHNLDTRYSTLKLYIYKPGDYITTYPGYIEDKRRILAFVISTNIIAMVLFSSIRHFDPRHEDFQKLKKYTTADGKWIRENKVNR